MSTLAIVVCVILAGVAVGAFLLCWHAYTVDGLERKHYPEGEDSHG